MKNTSGTLWATGKHDTTLSVVPTATGYDWVMMSPTTGKHVIKQKGGLEPDMSERVLAHWIGFQKLQTK